MSALSVKAAINQGSRTSRSQRRVAGRARQKRELCPVVHPTLGQVEMRERGLLQVATPGCATTGSLMAQTLCFLRAQGVSIDKASRRTGDKTLSSSPSKRADANIGNGDAGLTCMSPASPALLLVLRFALRVACACRGDHVFVVLRRRRT